MQHALHPLQTSTLSHHQDSDTPASLSKPPLQWSNEEVHTYLEWCKEEYGLKDVNLNRFNMNGKALCLLSKSDFCDRAPDVGDVLFYKLNQIRHEQVSEAPGVSPLTPLPLTFTPLSAHSPATPIPMAVPPLAHTGHQQGGMLSPRRYDVDDGCAPMNLSCRPSSSSPSAAPPVGSPSPHSYSQHSPTTAQVNPPPAHTPVFATYIPGHPRNDSAGSHGRPSPLQSELHRHGQNNSSNVWGSHGARGHKPCFSPEIGGNKLLQITPKENYVADNQQDLHRPPAMPLIITPSGSEYHVAGAIHVTSLPQVLPKPFITPSTGGNPTTHDLNTTGAASTAVYVVSPIKECFPHTTQASTLPLQKTEFFPTLAGMQSSSLTPLSPVLPLAAPGRLDIFKAQTQMSSSIQSPLMVSGGWITHNDSQTYCLTTVKDEICCSPDLASSPQLTGGQEQSASNIQSKTLYPTPPPSDDHGNADMKPRVSPTPATVTTASHNTTSRDHVVSSRHPLVSPGGKSRSSNDDGKLLWEFINKLLEEPERYDGYIRWESKERRVFRITDPSGLASLWGHQKNRSTMTYEKLSRSLRYYYKMNIICKEPGRRLTYRFMKPPTAIPKGQRGAKPGVPHRPKGWKLKMQLEKEKLKREAAETKAKEVKTEICIDDVTETIDKDKDIDNSDLDSAPEWLNGASNKHDAASSGLLPSRQVNEMLYKRRNEHALLERRKRKLQQENSQPSAKIPALAQTNHIETAEKIGENNSKGAICDKL